MIVARVNNKYSKNFKWLKEKDLEGGSNLLNSHKMNWKLQSLDMDANWGEQR